MTGAGMILLPAKSVCMILLPAKSVCMILLPAKSVCMILLPAKTLSRKYNRTDSLGMEPFFVDSRLGRK